MFYFVDWRTRKSMIFFNFTRRIIFRKKLSDSTFAKAENQKSLFHEPKRLKCT